MKLTPTQIDEVLKIVNRYTLTFIARVVGVDILSDNDKKVLKEFGIDVTKYPINNVTQAFRFGMLSQALGNNTAKLMNYETFKKYLTSGKFIPLNTTERYILDKLRQQTYSDVMKLSNRVENDIRDIFVRRLDDGRIFHTPLVTDAAKQVIEERKGLKELVSILGEQSQVWTRDLGRIADYTLHHAFNEGRACEIKKSGSRIYFDVYPGACKHCISAYLTEGVGSEPKTFTYDELKMNGTNVGKKSENWLPTLSPMHPWCRCTANEVPFGYKWNSDSRAFDVPDKQFERKSSRKSKVRVTVDGKTTVI